MCTLRNVPENAPEENLRMHGVKTREEKGPPKISEKSVAKGKAVDIIGLH